MFPPTLRSVETREVVTGAHRLPHRSPRSSSVELKPGPTRPYLTDSIMRSRTLAILLATLIVAFVSSSAEEILPPVVKLDKNLRRALLKALADLDTESAEQKSLAEAGELSSLDLAKLRPSESTTLAQETKTREPVRTIFSFDGFPSDEESPSEDKLQNTTFVESDKLIAMDTSGPSSATTIEPTLSENNRVFQAHDVVLPDKSSAIYEKNLEIVNDQLETRSVKSSSSSSANDIDIGSKPSSSFAVESLAISPSNGIATANALVAPSPTPSSPTVQQNSTKTSSKKKKEEPEVTFFQAPLVAAFTVQQDERGVPKSVVPIYSPNGDGQALTLQEQLDFKQQLLERQLAELQAQQIQQTQFLMRQQQLYEQQLRQKQQQQLFIQEQSRLKQIQEAEQLRLKRLEEQRIYQLQQQKQIQQFATGHNALFTAQPSFKNPSVNVQPSYALELPKSSQPPTFQANYNDQLRIQQLQRQQQQQQLQQLQQTRQQQLLQQPRLQQNFAGFQIDFQPPNSGPAQRFNRQEAFGNVGNFGFNDNRQQQPQQQQQQQQQHHQYQQQQLQQQSSNNRNHFGFSQHPSRASQLFQYNPYQAQQLQQQQQQQYRPQRPQTPAKQIQHLLFQSGVVGDLGTPQGTGGQEDLNIVSKVLALNVGAIPTNNYRYNGNNFGNTGNNHA